MAYQTIWNNKLRSILSVIGITIGILCIVLVYALVNSMEKNINDSFKNLGADVLFVQKWPWDDFGSNYPWWKYLNRPQTSEEDAQFLEKNLDKNAYGSLAFSFRSSETAEANKKEFTGVELKAVSFAYNEVQKVDLDQGRYFTQDEIDAGREVCIIGADLAKEFFGNNPIGQRVKLKNKSITVIGVCKKEGASVINASADNQVLIPFILGKGMMNYKNDNCNPQVLIKMNPNVSMDDVSFEINSIMRRGRRLGFKQEDNFSINRMSMITDQVSSLFSTIKVIGVVIGLFSMLVGCFGVANIMFVSVKERTKEIGIQKALGAKRIFILSQFLTESVLLCIVGGFIGILLVWILIILFNAILRSTESSITLFLSSGDISLGLWISILVGIVAGYIPANKASKLDPVEAMRK